MGPREGVVEVLDEESLDEGGVARPPLEAPGDATRPVLSRAPGLHVRRAEGVRVARARPEAPADAGDDRARVLPLRPGLAQCAGRVAPRLAHLREPRPAPRGPGATEGVPRPRGAGAVRRVPDGRKVRERGRERGRGRGRLRYTPNSPDPSKSPLTPRPWNESPAITSPPGDPTRLVLPTPPSSTHPTQTYHHPQPVYRSSDHLLVPDRPPTLAHDTTRRRGEEDIV